MKLRKTGPSKKQFYTALSALKKAGLISSTHINVLFKHIVYQSSHDPMIPCIPCGTMLGEGIFNPINTVRTKNINMHAISVCLFDNIRFFS